MISRRCAKSASIKEKFTDCEFGPDARFRVQPAPAAVCRCQGCAAPSIYAYDWETSDRLLSNGEYHRDGSYFDGIPEFMATRAFPRAQELRILETVRDKVPAEVFTTPYKNPVGGNAEAARNNLREAARLLKEAGFEIRDRKLVDPAGQAGQR